MKMHQATATGNHKFHQVWWRTPAVANMEMHQATATENHQEQSLRASCFHAGHENQPVAKTDHENHENHENHDSDENHQAILRYAQVTSRQPPSSERSERDGVKPQKKQRHQQADSFSAGRFIQRIANQTKPKFPRLFSVAKCSHASMKPFQIVKQYESTRR